MDEANFLKQASSAGFLPQQAALMWQCFAQRPHSHTSDEIIVDPNDGETLADYVVATDERVEELEAETVDPDEDEEENVG